MIKIFIIFFAFFYLGIFSQKFEWDEDRKLTWEDFRAPSNVSHSKSVAYTFTGIAYEVTHSSDPNGEISITVKNLFDVQKSWKKSPDPGAYLLNHEQLHFDITEIFTRKIRKMIAEKIKKASDYQKHFVPEYKKIYQEYQQFQSRYDSETEHSINKIKQAEYNLIIADLLREYDAYKTP